MNIGSHFFVVLCVALAPGACGRSATYRYKLTLSVDTPDGVKTGFNVAPIDLWSVSFPAQGEPHKTRGQGIYLDLGPNRRPLIALLTHTRLRDERLQEMRWGGDGPTDIVARVCLGVTAIYSYIDVVSKFGSCKSPARIAPTDLPDLVTFGDDQNAPGKAPPSMRMFWPVI